MSWVKQLWSRRRLYGELSEEIRAHLEENVEELVAAGMARKDAEAKARREFGNVTLTEETGRDVWRWTLIEDFFKDAQFGWRMLRKNPGFTAVAVLTLALGIGVNAAIFGLVDSALLNAMPFHEPERLVHVWTTDAAGETHTPFPSQFAAVRKYARTFDAVAAVGWVDNYFGSDEAGWQTLHGLVVSPNWLATLGMQPYLGREFREEEQTAGRDAAVMLSFACWRGRFHADEQIIGKQIPLNRKYVTVIGVLPAALTAYPEYAQVQTVAPLVLENYESVGALRVGGAARLRVVARLKPGTTLAQANAEMEGIARGLRRPGSTNDRSGRLLAEDFGEEVRHPGPTQQNARRGLLLMFVAAGVVLLIACANVAALLLARGVKRQREVALRSAIGCSRGRMIRQLLTESTLLFLCGGGVGLLVARWSEELLSKAAAGLISTISYVAVGGRVLAVGLGVSLLCALLFGMIPALQMTRVNLNDSLKDGIAKVTSGAGLRRPRNLLLVFQIAMAMVLIVGFGLLLRSMLRVQSAPFGFDAKNVLTATVSVPVARYADPASKARMMNRAVEQVRALPGVESAAAVDSLPLDGADSDQLKIERPAASAPIEEETWYLSVGAEYFSTLKIPMAAGRAFGALDRKGGAAVAIVNQTFAKVYFPGASPVGYHVAFADSPDEWREIVGVVADFRQRNPEEDPRPLVYLPLAQTLPGRWSMVIRMQAQSDMASAGQRVASALQPVDPQLYWRMGSMAQQIQHSESLTLRRPIITLLALFGGLALVLIVVGVFGVTSYFVAERTREIGVRVALGASAHEVVGLVLRESLGTALAGLAVGMVAAFALARFLPTGPIGWSGSGIYLYGVSRMDALTYSSAALLLVGVVTVASWKPARRAMRVDPMVALRYE